MTRRQPVQSPAGYLTTNEHRVIDLLTEAWAAFVALPRCHPTEVQEGIRAIHELQSLVMVRAAVRAHPTRFTHVEGFLAEAPRL